LILQPENPAEFGGRVYEMLGMAPAARRSSSSSKNSTTETLSGEAEVVEASEVIAESDPCK
jgi:heat shock protein beta